MNVYDMNMNSFPATAALEKAMLEVTIETQKLSYPFSTTHRHHHFDNDWIPSKITTTSSKDINDVKDFPVIEWNDDDDDDDDDMDFNNDDYNNHENVGESLRHYRHNTDGLVRSSRISTQLFKLADDYRCSPAIVSPTKSVETKYSFNKTDVHTLLMTEESLVHIVA